MDAEAFEALVRAEVAAIMTAAGHGGLADGGKKLRRARTARQRDEDRAFTGKAG